MISYCLEMKANKLSFSRRRLDCLPIVSHFLKEIGLREVLKGQIHHDRYVDALLAIVINICYGCESVYRLAEWCDRFDESCVPNGLGSDDVFGRALDKLFASDRTLIQSELIRSILGKFNISSDRVHSDSTSVKFFGRYLSQKNGGKKIKHGHSKDHRPDLKQLVYQLCVTSDGAIPLFHSTYDGNTSDVSTHVEIWRHLRLLLNRRDFVYVADSKLCVASTLAKIHDEGGFFITVVPKSRREHSEFATKVSHGQIRWEYLYKKQLTDLTEPKYDRISVAHGHYALEDGYKVYWYHSTAKSTRDADSRSERIARAEAELEAIVDNPGRGKASAESLKKKYQSVLTKYSVQKLLEVSVEQEDKQEFKATSRGRPSNETTYRSVTKTRYKLRYARNPVAIAQEATMDGVFPLVTNSGYTAKDAIQAYRWQPNLERRFSILKTNLSIAPVFLKSNTRIEALTALYFYAEIVVALIERQLRSAMATTGREQIPLLPERRQTKAPTWEQVRRTFYDISAFEIYQEGVVKEHFYDELSDIQKEVLELLAIREENFQ